MIKKEIKLGSKTFLVIDLTEPSSENTKVYPGDPKLEKEIFSDINKNGWQLHTYKMGDHHFHPHADAPKHYDKELQDKGIEIYDLNYSFNKAFLIDLSEKNLTEIKKEHIESYSKLLSEKTAVIIRTGYDKHLESNKPHEKNKIPYLNKEAADFISNFKNLKVIGIDSLTIGNKYVHKKFKDLLIVETLVHLYEIPKKEFDLQTSPVKTIGATGAPVIAYAFIEKN